MVSFIGLKTKVGGKNMEPTKKDWKLYRERIGDWQEAYMEKLVQKYVEYLQENLPASDKFWELENRIKNDKKKPGVLIEVRKSSMIWDIVRKMFPYAVEDDLCMELIGKTRQMAVNKNKNHVWKNMTDMELLRSAGLYEKNLVTGQKVFKMTCFF